MHFAAIHPRRPASALTMALFGGLALFLALWSAWCLEWVNTTLAGDLLVIGVLTLVAGYGMQLLRFHKGLGVPRLATAGFVKGALFWAAIAYFVLQVVWKERGFFSGMLGVLTVLEAFFAFVGFLSARNDFRKAEMAVAQGVLHTAGWFLLMGCFAYGVDCYFPMLAPPDGKGMLLKEMPILLAKPLMACIRTLTVPWTAFAGMLMVACAYGLRLRLFALSVRVATTEESGEKLPAQRLFHAGAYAAMAAFLAAVLFCTVAQGVLRKRHDDMQKKWMAYAATELRQEPHGETDAFSEEQRLLGRRTVEIANTLDDAAYPWCLKEFLRKTMADSPRLWLPAGEATAEQLAALEDSRAALLPVFSDLNEICRIVVDNSSQGRDSCVVAPGTLLLEEWNYLSLLELGDAPAAMESAARYACLAANEFFAESSLERRLNGIAAMKRWSTLRDLAPQKTRELLKRIGENLMMNSTEIHDRKVLVALCEENRQLLEDLRLGDSVGFHSWRMTLPFFDMMACADETSLMRAFLEKDRIEGVRLPKNAFGLYSRLLCEGMLKDYLRKRAEVDRL